MTNTASSMQPARNILHYLPFVSPPAVQSDRYEVDQALIRKRTISGVALSLIAIVGTCWACPALPILAAKYSMFATLSAAALPFVYRTIEGRRAHFAAIQGAIKDYREIQISPEVAEGHSTSDPDALRFITAMGKLASDPQALSALLQSPGVDLNKKVIGMNLATKIFSKSDSDRDFEVSLEVARIFARHVLEDQRAALWPLVREPRMMELLCESGWDLSVEDQGKKTPLMHWASSSDHKQRAVVIAALRQGVELTNSEGKHASTVTPKGSFLHTLFDQAESHFSPTHLPRETGLLSRLPWRPAVSKNSWRFEADFATLINRVSLAGLTVLMGVLIAPTSITAWITGKVLGGMVLASLGFWITEILRGEREGERLAVMEYLNGRIPSAQATATIASSVTAARLLVDYAPKGDRARWLSKMDEEGSSLLTCHAVDPEPFKLLAEHGADLLRKYKILFSETSALLKVVRQKSPDLLEFILSRNLVSPSTMPADLQIEMWTHVESEEVARCLWQHGFNINIQDQQGNTVLMRLVGSEMTQSEGPEREEKLVAQVKTLLAMGADGFNLKNKDGKTASALASKKAGTEGLSTECQGYQLKYYQEIARLCSANPDSTPSFLTT